MSTVARINAEINLRDNLSQPLKQAEDKVKQFSDRSRDELNRFSAAARKSWKEFGEALETVSQRAQTVGMAMSVGLTAPILGFSKVAVDAAARMESMRASMTAMTGSSSTAKDQLIELEKMAGRTASSYDLLVRASQGLIAGFDGDVKASNAVLERFATLSNVLGVSRGDFERLVINLTQIGGASRLTGDELREMASILPNLRTLLKDAFGTAQSEALAKMGITGRQALEGIMRAIDARGFKANTQTYNAQLQILTTEFFKLRVAAGEAFLPIARIVVQYLTPAFMQLSESISKMTSEQKRVAVALLGVAAAAGPVIMTLGTIGSAVSGLIAGWGSLSNLGGLLSRVLAASGGAAGILRVALAALTGPIGIVIAAVTALFLAWQNNFAGIRDIVTRFARHIGDMLADVLGNIKSTFDLISTVIVNTWKTIVRESQPLIDFYVENLQQNWMTIMSGVTSAFRYITDVINTSLAGWKVIFGAGWADLTNSMRASLLRMRGIAITILTNITQFVVNAFRAMTDWASAIPGIGQFYDDLMTEAQERVDAIRAEGAAVGVLADYYQKLAEAERKIKRPSIAIGQTAPPSQRRISIGGLPGLDGQNVGGGSVAPLDPFKIDPRLKEQMEARKKMLEEVLQLERDLAVEKLKASRAAIGDIISMEKFGKLYKDLTDVVDLAYVHRARDLEVFRLEQEALTKSAEEQRQQIEERANAQRELNRTVFESAAALQKQREQIYFTREEERARWEVTKGGYKDASGFVKALYVLQARLLDQSRATKEAGEKWRAFWSNLISKHKEWVQGQRDQANERYEEYVRRLTEEMLELSGAHEKLLRMELTEQFNGAAAGLRGLAAAWAVAFKVGNVMRLSKQLSDMKEKIELIREFARGISDVFENALNDLFENGFKSFFRSIADGFRDLVRQIAVEFLRLQMMRALLWGLGQMFGSGAKSDLRNAIPGLAIGGAAFRGQPYVVGERGPEVFVPTQNGRVVPNHAGSSLGGMVAAGTNIVVNLQVPSYSAFRKSEAQIAAQVFARAARARTREGK